VATVGSFIKVVQGWFDPGDFHFQLPLLLSPIIDFPGLSPQSVTAIDMVGLDKA